AEAIELYEQVRTVREKALPPDHPDTMYLLNNLAATYWLAKQLGKSIPLFEQLVPRLEKVLGPQHPETLRTIANLGVNYRDAGRYEEAISLLEKVHRDAQRHAFLRWVGRELLIAYARAGRSADAPVLAKANVEASQKALPPDSPAL